MDAFLAGQLSAVQVEQLEQHLDACPCCDEELTRRTADESFWDDTQTFLSSADGLPSDHDTDDHPPAHLEWEFDATPLDQLETELDLLLKETVADPFADPSPTSE